MQRVVSLPSSFTLLQVVPELETGGAEQTTLDVAQAVVRAGGTALVASRGGRMAARLREEGGRLTSMPVQSKNPVVMLGNAARLTALVREENVSIIHVRSRAPAFAALWAARVTRTPFVATYHGIYKAQSGLKRWYNAIMTRGDLVIANSDFTRDHVLAEHHVPPEKMVTIPRGIDLERFDPALVTDDRVDALRTAWNIPRDGRTIILLAGRLTRIKGHLTVIEAARRLTVPGRRDFLILFAGDDQGRTGYAAEVQAAIDAGGLQDCIRIVGHCSDMPAAYLLADLAILPTLVPESFGRAAVEPQVMGRPVIAANHGGVTETILDGKTGWLTPVGDPDAWASALGHAIDCDPARRTAMGKLGQDRSRKLYSAETMCAATLAAYERVLEARR